MTSDEAGRLKAAWKANNGGKPCEHGRMVDNLTGKRGKKTRYLVCRECGEVIPDPQKKGKRNRSKNLGKVNRLQVRR